MHHYIPWIVVGAGPAGITTIGKLLDNNILPADILWIDPLFEVGDLGQKWSYVLGNTDVSIFIDFLNATNSFDYQSKDFALNHLNRHEPCQLKYLVEPLQWITNHFRKSVKTHLAVIDKIEPHQGGWYLKSNENKEFFAQKVVLALGCEPIIISSTKPLIPIEVAMNLELLKNHCDSSDIIGVIGSSHSAIVALYNVMHTNASRIVHFYRSPLKYSIKVGADILYDNQGLRGYSAQWARENLEKNQPERLERIHMHSTEYEEKFHTCSKIIQAIGFKRHAQPIIKPFLNDYYDTSTGIIAPGLFGIGIAYPHLITPTFGGHEFAIGVWDFSQHLKNVLPFWLQYNEITWNQ